MSQEAFWLNQQQFYICLYNSLYATDLFCLNQPGLETPDHHLSEAALHFNLSPIFRWKAELGDTLNQSPALNWHQI